jgi:hypothetical protein
MAALYASSIRGRIAVGSNTGYRVARLGDQIDGDSLEVLQSPRCATFNGFSVHANVSIPAQDRMRLERLCRYAARDGRSHRGRANHANCLFAFRIGPMQSQSRLYLGSRSLHLKRKTRINTL